MHWLTKSTKYISLGASPDQQEKQLEHLSRMLMAKYFTAVKQTASLYAQRG